MRKEAFTTGSYVHVIKRGTRGLPIVRSEADRFRFLLMLTHFNDVYASQNWYRDTLEEQTHKMFARPSHWPPQEKIVNIIAFCLVENHFHLILEELSEGSIAKFMHRLCTSMAMRFNEHYGTQGSLFQSAYRAKTIDDDTYFRYVVTYVQFKNALDTRSEKHIHDPRAFTEAYDWACAYPYSSLGDVSGSVNRPIIDKEFFSSLFTPREYREYCKDFFYSKVEADEVTASHTRGFFE